MSRRKNGSTLVMAVITFAVVMILGTLFLTKAMYSNNYSNIKYNDQQAYYVAKSAIDTVICAFQNAPQEMKKLIPNAVGDTNENIEVQQLIDAEGKKWDCTIAITKKSGNEIRVSATAKSGAGAAYHVQETVSAVLQRRGGAGPGIYADSMKIQANVNMKDGRVYAKDGHIDISSGNGGGVSTQTERFSASEIITLNGKVDIKEMRLGVDIGYVGASDSITITDNGEKATVKSKIGMIETQKAVVISGNDKSGHIETIRAGTTVTFNNEPNWTYGSKSGNQSVTIRNPFEDLDLESVEVDYTEAGKYDGSIILKEGILHIRNNNTGAYIGLNMGDKAVGGNAASAVLPGVDIVHKSNNTVDIEATSAITYTLYVYINDKEYTVDVKAKKEGSKLVLRGIMNAKSVALTGDKGEIKVDCSQSDATDDGSGGKYKLVKYE